MNDRERAHALLKLDTLLYPQWRELRDIVDRNQNDGVFTEAQWIALRDYHSAFQHAQRARSAARAEFGLSP